MGVLAGFTAGAYAAEREDEIYDAISSVVETFANKVFVITDREETE